MTQPIYLDYNATTPHAGEVVEAMRPYLEEHFGNPSSSHWYGRATREAVERARSQVAGLLNCSTDEIIFTSGGTESNNYAIQGIARSRRREGRHIITTQIEHPSITAVCDFLQRTGCEISYLPVDEKGLVDARDVERAIRPETILITVMHANNEVGTIQPVEEIGRISRARGIAFHTDAAQSAGKIAVDVEAMSAGLVSLAGHKLYAPKGVGALYIRRGIAIEPLMHGAGQEGGRRAGTENVLEIVGLGRACEIAQRDLAKNSGNMRLTRDRLESGLRKRIDGVRVNGHQDRRLPNTLSASFDGVEADALLGAIEDSIAASAGAACHSGQVRISQVLAAMGVPERWAKGTLRFSTGRMTGGSEIDTAIEVICDAVARLRGIAKE